MGSRLNSFPDHIEIFKPAIGCGLISHLSPDPLLGIEPRLVRRKVRQANSRVGTQETANFLSLMPSGAVYKQPDLVPLESMIELTEASKESFSVALRTAQHSHLSQQRCNPAKDIQPFSMLAGSQNPQPLADSGPPFPKTRMQGKTGFIFKDNGFLRFQRAEFFLTCGETSWHPHHGPANRYTPLASSGTPIDASTTEPVAPSDIFQIDFSSERLKSDHPSQLDSGQNPRATSPNVPPIAGELAQSAAPVAQVFLPALGIPDLAHSPCASTRSSFDASYQALRLSIPDADPPMSAKKPQFLFQKGLPEFPELLLKDRLGWLRDAPKPNWVFA
jgi:hypothetical protein